MSFEIGETVTVAAASDSLRLTHLRRRHAASRIGLNAFAKCRAVDFLGAWPSVGSGALTAGRLPASPHRINGIAESPMPLYVIPFPAFDPVLISFGPIAIRWYALAYIVGILLGWLYARAHHPVARQLWGGPAPMTVGDFDDFVLWVTLGIILGGRLGYVLFYNPGYFAAHPLEILQLWKGGMSFHGGFLGCVLAVVLFARHRGLSILSLGDITCAAGTIGIFLGRIANFINGELWGRPTDVPWAMVFPTGGPLPRHPSQLYEAAARRARAVRGARRC